MCTFTIYIRISEIFGILEKDHVLGLKLVYFIIDLNESIFRLSLLKPLYHVLKSKRVHCHACDIWVNVLKFNLIYLQMFFLVNDLTNMRRTAARSPTVQSERTQKRAQIIACVWFIWICCILFYFFFLNKATESGFKQISTNALKCTPKRSLSEWLYLPSLSLGSATPQRDNKGKTERDIQSLVW